MDLNHEYLLSLDQDRIASWFRREAGLIPKAQPYPFWESEDVWGKGPLAGHIMGFYLSSMAMMYQSTGDEKIIEKLNYTLSELEECQKAGKDGYLLATINGRHVFQDVVEGNFKTSNPLINDTWEPVYIMNKIMLGLNSVYTRCGIPKAGAIFLKMADWFGDSVLNKLTHDQIQELLVCEHGSINESYIDAYKLSGDKKYLQWANMLNDEDMWVPLSQGKDVLNGWHANTQIPKFTGFENIYQYTSDQKYTDAARFFWSTVVSKHTWSIGGNSTGEHFFTTSEFTERLPLIGGPESCNSVNMLRLTEVLYKDYAEPEKIDYYEKVLFNHILSNYDPDSAMCVYYTSMRPGHYKVYGTKYHSFWCCTGTGMESPSKFGQMIFAYDESSLYVNLFLPSELNWKDKKVRITQKTSFPDIESSTIVITTEQPVKFNLKIRQPKWLKSAIPDIKVNGKKISIKASPDGYVAIERVWKNGDEIIVGLPGKISIESIPGGNEYISVLYGPIVLAAKMDNQGLNANDFRNARDVVARKIIPLSDAPTFAGNYDNITKGITRKPGSVALFQSVSDKNLELVPFNTIHYSRYAVYFRHFENDAAYSGYKKNLEDENTFMKSISAMTVDRVIPGDTESEKAHKLEFISSSKTDNGVKKSRSANDGGYFMYELQRVKTGEQLIFVVDAGKDEKAVYDIFLNGRLAATVDHGRFDGKKGSGLIIQSIPFARGVLVDKSITVKFQARNNSRVAEIYDVRMISNDGKEDLANKRIQLF